MMSSRRSKYRISKQSPFSVAEEEDVYWELFGDTLPEPEPDYDKESVQDIKTDVLKTESKKAAVRRGKSRLYSLDSVSPGDAISFKRKGYKHHAIVSDVVSKSRFCIIHLTGDSADSITSSLSSGPKATISETAIEFDERNVIFKYQYENERTDGRHPLEIARAIFRNGLPHSYNFLKFNCEHFICYCITGIVFSNQTGKENKVAAQKLDELVKESSRNPSHTTHQNTKESGQKQESFYLTDGSNNAYMNLTPNDESRYTRSERRQYSGYDGLQRNRSQGSRRGYNPETVLYYPNQRDYGYYNYDGYDRYMYEEDDYDTYAFPDAFYY